MSLNRAAWIEAGVLQAPNLPQTPHKHFRTRTPARRFGVMNIILIYEIHKGSVWPQKALITMLAPSWMISCQGEQDRPCILLTTQYHDAECGFCCRMASRFIWEAAPFSVSTWHSVTTSPAYRCRYWQLLCKSYMQGWHSEICKKWRNVCHLHTVNRVI